MKQKIINYLSTIPFINRYFTGIATIFMLHRVDHLEKGKLKPNENMKVSPEFLESFIVELLDKGYDFISLDELYDILKSKKSTKKKIVFTLDDGYKDNYELAYPIFKKYDVPFTIYVTTSFPNKSVILWWYILEDLILENDFLIVDEKKYICRTMEEKNRVFLEVRRVILALEQRDLLNQLNKIFVNYDIDWFSRNNELCMSWDEIKILSKDSLCTIAGHTVNHYVFHKLNDKEIITEIVDANKEIEKEIEKKVEHFAYPFGSINEVKIRELKIVEKLQFKTVTTTRKGTIYFKHENYTNCCLPRLMLKENFKIKDIGKFRRKKVVSI